MHQKMLAVGVLLKRLIYPLYIWSVNQTNDLNLNTGIPVSKKILKFKNTFCIERPTNTRLHE